MRDKVGVIGYRLGDRNNVLLGLRTQRTVMLVGDGVEQRADTRSIVIKSEVRSREHRCHFTAALVEVGEDANHVARFLRVGGNQHLFFKQAQQMRRKRPGHQELLALALVLSGGHPHQTQALRHVRFNERSDLRFGDLQPVGEQTMQQHSASILLDPLGVAARHEVDGDRIDAMHLLIGVAATVTNRNHEHQQFRMLLGDLGQDLDKVERPVLPGVLLGVGQAVIPSLEFVQKQHRWGVLQQLEDKFVRRDVSFGRPHALPLALDEGAVGMALKQQVPKKLEALPVKTFADHRHPNAQTDLADLRIT